MVKFYILCFVDNFQIYTTQVGYAKCMAQNTMTRGSKTLVILFFILLTLSVTIAYYEYFIARNFELFYDDYGESVQTEDMTPDFNLYNN